MSQPLVEHPAMRVIRGYRTELDPNLCQRCDLARHAGAARWAYNWGLQRKIESYRATGKSPDAIELHRELNALKPVQYPWLYSVSKCSPQEALRDLDTAFRNFRRGLKRKRRVGFPRFRSKKRGPGSFRLTGKIRIEDRRIRLPRIGWIRLKEHGYLPVSGARILSVTVSERARRWYVAVRVEQEIQVRPVDGPATGVDVGILRWATTSEGVLYEAPRRLKRLERSLSKAQRAMSRKRPGSRNRTKAARRVAGLYARLANVRTDFVHKVTTDLTRTKSVIVIEDLNVAAMLRNRKLARAISAQSWGVFRRMLSYKTQWRGGALIVAARFYPSSKMCSCAACGSLAADLPLSVRVFTCGACGCSRDRDLNAAINLRNVAVSSTDTQNACGGARPSSRPPDPKIQESVGPSWPAPRNGLWRVPLAELSEASASAE